MPVRPCWSATLTCAFLEQGFYCQFEGQGNISGPCDPGFFCSVTNLTEVRPTGAVDGSGPCPKGHWCARGTVGDVVLVVCYAGCFSALMPVIAFAFVARTSVCSKRLQGVPARRHDLHCCAFTQSEPSTVIWCLHLIMPRPARRNDKLLCLAHVCWHCRSSQPSAPLAPTPQPWATPTRALASPALRAGTVRTRPWTQLLIRFCVRQATTAQPVCINVFLTTLTLACVTGLIALVGMQNR